jgi:hypothetical protein
MISPKEKADELVKGMYKVHSNSASLVTLYFAKQCALIAVDEIIEANPYKWVPFMDQYTETVLTSNIPYWQEVKQEIELIRVGK